MNAAAAIGRIGGRTRSPDAVAAALCPCLSDPRAYLRANALAGMALAGTRCGDGSIERGLLASDPSEDSRVAAAIAIGRSERPEDRRALEHCVHRDPSGAVAARCRARLEAPGGTHAVLVYVVGDGHEGPRPGVAYALSLADGTIRVGTTDRRGATLDPVAPEGMLTLRPPSEAERSSEPTRGPATDR